MTISFRALPTTRWTREGLRRPAIAWLLAAVAAALAGVGLSLAQREYLEADRRAGLRSAVDREALSLMQRTLIGPDMGAVESGGLIDPLIKVMTLETDPDRAALVRPGEQHLAAAAATMGADAVFVLNRGGIMVAEWTRHANQRGIGIDVSARAYFRQAMEGRASVFPTVSPLLRERALIFAAPIHERQDLASPVVGALVARKRADELLDPFLAAQDHAGALVVSPHGVVFAASRPEWRLALTSAPDAARDQAMTARWRPAAELVDPARRRFLPFAVADGTVARIDGRRMAVAVARIDWNDADGPWALVLMDDLTDATGAARQAGVALLCAAVFLGGFALSRLTADHRRQRERSAAEIAARGDEFRVVFRMAPIGICLVVRDRIEFVNPVLSEQLGAELFHPWPHRYADEASETRVRRVLRERERVLDVEVGLLDAQGGPRIYLLSSMPLDYEGDKAATVLWLVDITRRQEAAREARAAMEAAKDAALAKSSFLAGMSHEIRSPMNIIVGMSDLALQTGLDARQRNYLEKVNGAALSLLDLIDDILDFSSIESGRMTLEQVPFQLDQVLERLVDLIGLRAEDKGVELLIHRPADVPSALIGDPMRLGQVLINLGANAVKFTQAGEVIVAVERAASGDDWVELRFSVTDSGIGMTQETISRLFHSFNQADTSTTRQYGGSGLGLAVCRQLVEMMGGHIQVSSQPGEGSTFSFTVRLGQRQGVRGAVAGPSTMADLSRLRVLVADDNRAARDILGALCAGFGMGVGTAVNGANAAQCVMEAEAEKRPYDLVLMDWQMPVLNGIEATRLIAGSRLASPPAILLVTAFGRDATVAAALGEIDPRHRPRLLSKPVTASTLLSAIGEATGRPVAPAPASPYHGAATRAAMARLTGMRLLVVEDDPVSRELSVELLRATGLEVSAVPDGQAAIELLARPDADIDVVLMDCHMPGMDGYETARRLRQDPRQRELPIIALTASATLEARERIQCAGMDGLLSKPLSVDRLFDVLTRVAQGSAATADVLAGGLPRGAATPPAPDPALDALLRELAALLQASDAAAVEAGEALARELDRRPTSQARAQLLRRVAAAAAGFRFEEALALLSWDAGAGAAP